jgi:hypothetical protein
MGGRFLAEDTSAIEQTSLALRFTEPTSARAGGESQAASRPHPAKQ